MTVQVTYDENGRVTQASGGDATALRIARQKRFPAGKAGSATAIPSTKPLTLQRVESLKADDHPCSALMSR